MAERRTARPDVNPEGGSEVGPDVDRTQTELPRSGSDAGPTGPARRPADHTPARGSPLVPAHPGDGSDGGGERFRRGAEHARGGLGRIVRARDVHLRRTVAIKELLKSSAFAESLFVREALITARLQHPGIVPVHEAGRWPSGEPYYVMKLVSGQTLKELIESRGTLVDRLALLPNVIAVAETIAYAHSERVIHRDLKPANIIVGEYGETVVVDWGLARDRSLAADGEPGAWGGKGAEPAVDIDSYYSVSGKVVGTPAYMAPEQARGDEMDERCDVYALGAVLYELLCGRPPYPGRDPRRVLERVLAGPPLPVDERAAGAPEDLVAIVRKAMARDPAERYPSAVELAEDLRRFQTGQLVSAHQYSTAALVRRWLRRHRSLVSAAAAGLAVLMVVGVLAVRRVVAERNQAWIAHSITEHKKDELLMLNTQSALAEDPTAALAWLKRVPLEDASYARARRIADEAIARGVARHAFRHDDWVHGVAFSPDGAALATVCRDGGLRLWDMATGRGRLVGETASAMTAVAFSPDGRHIATGGQLGEVRIWNVDGSVHADLPGSDVRIGHLRYARDGQRLIASSDVDDQVWDVPSRALIAAAPRGAIAYDERTDRVALAREDGRVTVAAPGRGGQPGEPGLEIALPARMREMAFTPDGSRLFGLGHDGALRVIDVAARPGPGAGGASMTDGAGGAGAGGASMTGGAGGETGTPGAPGKIERLWANASECHRPASTADGRRLVMPCRDNTLGVVALSPGAATGGQTGQARLLRGHLEWIWDVALAPDGHTVVTASDDQTARVWDLATGTSRVLRGHTDDVVMVAISPDGEHAATASLDGSARVWRIGARDHRRVIGAEGAAAGMSRVGPHGLLIASTSGALRLWDTTAWRSRDLALPARTEAWWTSLVVSRDGRRAAFARDDGVAVWDLSTGTSRSLPVAALATRLALDLSPDGDEVVIAGARGVETWSLAADIHEVITRAPAVAAVYAPGGDEMAVGTRDRIEIWDRARRRVTETLPRRAAVGGGGYEQDALYSPDGAWLAFPTLGAVALWNRRTGSLRTLDIGRSRVYGMAFSADGAHLTAALDDRTVRVWPTREGPGHVLRGHRDATMSAVFSPDGKYVVSASHDLTIRVWSLATGGERVLRGHVSPIERLVALDDGRLVSLSRNGTLRIWNISDDPTPDSESLARRIADETTTEIGADNRPWTAGDRAGAAP